MVNAVEKADDPQGNHDHPGGRRNRRHEAPDAAAREENDEASPVAEPVRDDAPGQGAETVEKIHGKGKLENVGQVSLEIDHEGNGQRREEQLVEMGKK